MSNGSGVDIVVLDEIRRYHGSKNASIAQRLLTLGRELGADVQNKQKNASIRLPGRPGAKTKEVTLFFIAKRAATFWIHDEYLSRWPSAGVDEATMHRFDDAVVRLFTRKVKSRQMNDLSKAVPLMQVEEHFEELASVLREAARGILGQPSVPNTAAGAPEDAPITIEQADGVAAPFGDPVRNALVERAAVSHTSSLYTRAGWSVVSVERDKVGYDLLCRRGTDEQHVEVKGLSGARAVFIITANELASARTNPRFVLSVVTQALSSPVEHRWQGHDFLREFALAPVAFKASRISESPGTR